MRNKKEIEKYYKIESEDRVPHTVLDQAAAELQNRKTAEQASTSRAKRVRLAPILSVAACLLIVAIVLPVVLLTNRQVNFNNKDYKFNDLVKQTITSIENFNAENGTEYRFLHAEECDFVQYAFQDKLVMVSQEKQSNSKSFMLWAADENINVDIFAPFASLSESSSIEDNSYYYQAFGDIIRCKVFYLGYQYNIEFQGYALDEIQSLIATLF